MKCIDCGIEFYCNGYVVCKRSLIKGNTICLCKKCTLKEEVEIKKCGYREIGEQVEFT